MYIGRFFILAVGIGSTLAALCGLIWGSLSYDPSMPVEIVWLFNFGLGLYCAPHSPRPESGVEFLNGRPTGVSFLILAFGLVMTTLGVAAWRSKTAYYAAVWVVGLGYAVSCFSIYQSLYPSSSGGFWGCMVFRVGFLFLLVSDYRKMMRPQF